MGTDMDVTCITSDAVTRLDGLQVAQLVRISVSGHPPDRLDCNKSCPRPFPHCKVEHSRIAYNGPQSFKSADALVRGRA